MARWKVFSKLKFKEKKNSEPQEKIEEEKITEPKETLEENENVEEEEILVEYKETLYTSSHASKKGKKQVFSDQRIWRDMDSIEKNIDDLKIKKVEKPVTELEKKVDKIISRNIETPASKKPPNVIYVVSKPQPGQVKGDWAVRSHGKIYSHHRKKEVAIKEARKIAEGKNATVLVQNIHGTFSQSYKPKQKK